MCFKSEEYFFFAISMALLMLHHHLKRILGETKKAWDSKFPLALRADRVIMKKSIGCAPFDLAYGIQERLPQNNLNDMYKFIQVYDSDIIDDM